MKKKLLPALFITALSFFPNENLRAQNAITLDGTDDFIQTNYTGITGNGARTVEAWIKTTANAAANQQVITDWGANATGSRFTFNILNNNALRLEVNGSGVYGTIPVNNGQWHHVAVVYDPAATTKVSLYVDGVLDVAGNLTTTVNTGSTVKLRVGKRIDDAKFFQGTIDEVRVWNVARTVSEIAGNKDIEFCSPQSNLVAYYKLNEGTAAGTNTGITSVADFSGSNNAGTLNNLALSGTSSNFTAGAALTQTSINNTLTNNSGVLTATENGAGTTYQWLDCNNGNSPVASATNQTFTPVASGSYAVRITKNGCVATSACELVSVLATNQVNFKNAISLYPNPTSDNTSVQLGETYESINVTLRTITGQIVSQHNFKNTNAFNLNVKEAAGIYFVSVETNTGESAVLKLVKK